MCLLFIVSAIFSPEVNAAPGDLDLTFSQDGKLYDVFNSIGVSSELYGSAIQPDGKIVAVGDTRLGSSFSCGIIRYKTDGTLDTTFDGDGKVTTEPGAPFYCRAAAIQSDGKIVVAGYGIGSAIGVFREVFMLIRLNSDGSPDTSFGGNGKVITPVGNYRDQAVAVAIQADGKIVAAGYSSTSSEGDFALARYNTDGSLDTSFNGSGKVTTNIMSVGSSNDYANAVAIQPDGKIVLAGWSERDFALARYNSNGSLDNTFDGDGRVTTSINGASDIATAVTIQTDGKIVAAGKTSIPIQTPTGSGDQEFALVRYNTDGSLDTSFDSDGKVVTSIPGTKEQANAVAVQSDGKIVITGDSVNNNSTLGHLAVLRYNANGSLDTSFNGSGLVITQMEEGRSSVGNVLMIQPDGKIIASGIFSGSFFLLARYNSDGSLDNTFGFSGLAINNVGYGFSSARAVAVQPNGRIVVAGCVSQGGYCNFGVARYNADGSPDTTFDGDGKVTLAFTNNIDEVRAVAVQSDGKIVVVGTTGFASSPPQTNDIAVARFNVDGSLDNTFDGDGKVIINQALFEYAMDVAIQPDGKIVLAGSRAISGEDQNIVVHRLNPNGSFDASFGANGTAVVTNLSSDAAAAVTIQTDGKIIAAGGASNGSNFDFAVIRFNANGSIDTSFDSDGIVTTPILTGDDAARSVAIQPDGKIVASGIGRSGTNSKFAVVRYNPNGSVDTSFGASGMVTTAILGNNEPRSLAIQQNGKIIVGGYTSVSTNNEFALIRYNSDGSLDTTFSSDGKSTFDLWGLTDDRLYAMALDANGRIVAVGETNGNFAVARILGDFVPTARPPYDYDGDGKTDIAIFRSTGAEWWINRSSTNTTLSAQFGASTDKVISGDFTGDGKADIAIFRPSNGYWYIVRSEDNSFYAFPFGAGSDVPVAADFDGDGKADAAVFRPSNSGWYIQKTSGGIESLTFGAAGDSPVVADYDGDGKADIAITRINNGTREWWIRRSSDGQVFSAAFGVTGDRAVQGDYTGDGKADIAIFRPSNGYWYVVRSEDFSYYGFPFGTNGDVPTPGDYDGDGKFDAAVFRSSNSGWYQLRTTQGFTGITYGASTDTPISSVSVP